MGIPIRCLDLQDDDCSKIVKASLGNKLTAEL